MIFSDRDLKAARLYSTTLCAKRTRTLVGYRLSSRDKHIRNAMKQLRNSAGINYTSFLIPTFDTIQSSASLAGMQSTPMSP